jgi:AraC-like DNA-binding protein
MASIQAISAPRASADIRVYAPAESLRPLVSSYYFLESIGPLADFAPPEQANIRFAIEGAWRLEDGDGKNPITPSNASLFGPSDRGRRFATDGGLLMGVGLTATGWLTLIGGHASDFANLILPLGRQLGPSGLEIQKRLALAFDDSERIAILEAILCGRPARFNAYCAIAAQIQDAIMSGKMENVADLAEKVGVEHRRLLRVCTSAFGFPPVRLLRRQRFLRTLHRMRDKRDQPIGQLIDASYYDQAHFNRDFKAYMGMTPRAYFRMPHDMVDRVVEEDGRAFDRRRADPGEPTQASSRELV